jgi:hypothetical protein
MRVMCFSILYILRISDNFTQRYVFQQELIQDRLVERFKSESSLIKHFVRLGHDQALSMMYKYFQQGKTFSKQL